MTLPKKDKNTKVDTNRLWTTVVKDPLNAFEVQMFLKQQQFTKEQFVEYVSNMKYDWFGTYGIREALMDLQEEALRLVGNFLGSKFIILELKESLENVSS